MTTTTIEWTDPKVYTISTSTELVPLPPALFTTREEWLVAAVSALRPLFSALEEDLPAVRVSVGWPGGPGPKGSVIGQCWATRAANDAVSQVFISPVLDYPPRILDVLLHELIHAVDDNASGHKGRFVKIARALGLEGPPTATSASPELAATLGRIAQVLGTYPHARLMTVEDQIIFVGGVPTPRLRAEGPRKQGTRMRKVQCVEGTGYKVRMTRQWLDAYGPPLCPCHREPMLEVD